MSMLRDRIFGKKVPEVPTSASYKDYGPIKEIPLVRIQIYGNGIGYDEPIVASDGGLYMPTGPGQWGQLYKAGR